ncbi:MAG: LPS assembly lipoprotein LptE, partial [Planctomycetota bacterium]
ITDALIKEIHARTPYQVVSEAEADSILTGSVMSTQTTELSNQQGSGLAQELLRTVTIDFTWKDVRTGRILAQRVDFEAGDVYIASRPINERAEVAEWAIAEELARDIVSSMRDAW